MTKNDVFLKIKEYLICKNNPKIRDQSIVMGDLGPQNIQRGHRLFSLFSRTVPPIVLKVESTRSYVISVRDFNGTKYFLNYSCMRRLTVFRL